MTDIFDTLDATHAAMPRYDEAFSPADLAELVAEIHAGEKTMAQALDLYRDRLADQDQESQDAMIHASANTTTENEVETVPYVTRCYFSWPYDAIAPEIDPEDPEGIWPLHNIPENHNVFDRRCSAMYDAMARAVEARYPNAVNKWQESTGWSGDSANFSPRADNGGNAEHTPDTYHHDPHFLEWLIDTTDKLAAEVIAANPWSQGQR